jgi:hypothetical protein
VALIYVRKHDVAANSTDAANIAVRNRYAVRLDAVRAITVSSTFSGPDDL